MAIYCTQVLNRKKHYLNESEREKDLSGKGKNKEIIFKWRDKRIEYLMLDVF